MFAATHCKCACDAGAKNAKGKWFRHRDVSKDEIVKQQGTRTVLSAEFDQVEGVVAVKVKSSKVQSNCGMSVPLPRT